MTHTHDPQGAQDAETPLLNSRIPLNHPEYRYPDSKNIYWEKIKSFPNLVFSDHSTEVHRGRWRSQFISDYSENTELHVEIGCNAGHVILEWARQNPKNRYIGIDWKFKSIFRAAEKAQSRELNNLCFFRAHADRLKYMFGENEVDRLCLFFPDPWPKKAQQKNRFLNAEHLRDAAQVVKKGGIFHIKTDHAGYFEAMLGAISEVTEHWETVEMTRNLHASHPNPTSLKIPDVTLFERLFIKDGLPIHQVLLKKK